MVEHGPPEGIYKTERKHYCQHDVAEMPGVCVRLIGQIEEVKEDAADSGHP